MPYRVRKQSKPVKVRSEPQTAKELYQEAALLIHLYVSGGSLQPAVQILELIAEYGILGYSQGRRHKAHVVATLDEIIPAIVRREHWYAGPYGLTMKELVEQVQEEGSWAASEVKTAARRLIKAKKLRLDPARRIRLPNTYECANCGVSYSRADNLDLHMSYCKSEKAAPKTKVRPKPKTKVQRR